MHLDGLCFITDRKICDLSCKEMVLQALKAGIRWVQYREKDLSRRSIYEESVELRRITRKFDALFIVNDHVDIASAVGADGVHLGQEDLPFKNARKILGKDKIIGISTHDLEQAKEAEAQGADYIGFGPVFHTLTKDAGSPKGIEILTQIRKQVRIPIVAIGGINHENIRSVLGTRVDAVAVASAMLKGNIEQNARNFIHILNSIREKCR
ncbi:MAG: thiamine phosphate synthase [Nitrospirota bacterium]